MRSLSAYIRVLRKTSYKILLPTSFNTKETEKTDKSSAASLRPPTRAKTEVDGKSMSVGHTSIAGI